MGEHGGHSADGRRTAPRGGRALLLVTGIAAGLLALVNAADLVQMLLGIPFTANDLMLVLYSADSGGRARGLPLNLAQTAALALLTTTVLVGGALCFGRRQGLARLGGVAAVLSVTLPYVIPLSHAAVARIAAATFSTAAYWTASLYPYAAIGAGLAFSAAACVVLVLVSIRPPSVVTAARLPGLAVVAALPLVIEGVWALGQQLIDDFSWWGFGWIGVSSLSLPAALALSCALVVVMVLGGLGAGSLLAGRSVLLRVGGALVLAALALRVLSQVISMGLLAWLMLARTMSFDLELLLTLERIHVFGVAVLAAAGMLLAVVGVFVPTSGAQSPGPAQRRDAAGPGTVSPGPAGPGAVGPGPVGSGTVGSGAASPGASSSPGVGSPGATPPGAAGRPAPSAD